METDYPTDAAHEGRSRHAACISAAMLAPECLRQQSLRHYVQVESCQPPFWIGTIDIWMHWAAVKAINLSPNVLGPSYLAQPTCSDLPSAMNRPLLRRYGSAPQILPRIRETLRSHKPPSGAD